MEAVLKSLETSATIILRFEINLKKTARDKRTATFVDSRLGILEQYWQQYLTTFMKFMQFPTAGSSQYEIDENFTAVQDFYLETKSLLYSWKPADQPNTTQVAAAQAVPMTGKLPKLEIPHFSGELREWETFRDLFKAMVHEHKGLSLAVKLQYLKTNVTGEAAQLLRNIPVSDANYNDAWTSLVDRYDNPRILIQSHVRALLSLAAVGKESASGIKRLLDASNESVRALKNLKQPVQHWDAILVDLTCQRLDQQSRRDWETSLGDSRDFPTSTKLSTFLETRVHALEAARATPSPSSQANSSSQPASKSQKPNVSSHTALTPPEEPTKKTVRKCPLCSDSHYIGACTQYKDLDISHREEAVRRLRLCRNCLGHRHLAAAWPSTKRCNVCGTNHHTSLHPTDWNSVSTTEGTSHPAKEKSKTPATAPTPVQTNHASTVVPRAKTVLLGTAVVTLTSQTGRRVPARILIDPCFEGSFASEAKAQALRATRTPAIVPVSGVAGAKAGVSKSLISVVVSSRIDPAIQISVVACVLPRVTGDLPSRVAPQSRWNHVVDLPLADPEFDKPGRIDMILGADVYRELLMKGVRFGPPGTPLAQETIFGWILTGLASTNPNSTNNLSRGVNVHHCSTETELSGLVRKFWELEEISARTGALYSSTPV